MEFVENTAIGNTTLENKYLYSYFDDDKDNNKTNIFLKNTFIYGWGKNKFGEFGVGHTNNMIIAR
jgi:hypothetical protein